MVMSCCFAFFYVSIPCQLPAGWETLAEGQVSFVFTTALTLTLSPKERGQQADVSWFAHEHPIKSGPFTQHCDVTDDLGLQFRR